MSYTNPELERFEGAFEEIDENAPLVVGCGDDRPPTLESQAELGIDGPYLRIYGAEVGVARAVTLTLAAQNLLRGVPEDQALGFAAEASDFTQLTGFLTVRFDRLTGKRLVSHSRCAYEAKIGAVTHLGANDPSIHQLIATDAETVFGGSNPSSMEVIATANDLFGRHFYSGAYVEAAFTEADAQRTPHPIMHVQGEHADPQRTGVVANLDPTQVSNPIRWSAEGGDPFYVADIGPVASLVLQTVPELSLDPDLLVRSIFHDIVPVRYALTGGRPEMLPFSARGSYDDLRESLDEVKANALRY